MTERLSITPEMYHKLGHVSASSLNCLRTCGPLEYHARYIEGTVEAEQTDAMRRGKITHALFEAPSEWQERIVVIPSAIEDHPCVDEINDAQEGKASLLEIGDAINLRKPTHRAYMDTVKADAEATGKMWCTEDEARDFIAQLEAILAEPICRAIIERGGNREQAAVHHHRGTGLACKALADVDQMNFGIDLKTTREKTPFGFAKDARQRGYHIQLAHYEDVFDWEKSGIIAVTNEPPFFAMYYEFDDEMRQEAVEKREWLLSDLYARRQSGDELENWLPEGWGTTSYIGVNGIVEGDLVDWEG